MILGADWLESCSPMWVHWSQKILKFTHCGKRIKLKGLNGEAQQCATVFAVGLQGMLDKQNVTCCLQLQVMKLDEERQSSNDLIHSVDNMSEGAMPLEIQRC